MSILILHYYCLYNLDSCLNLTTGATLPIDRPDLFVPGLPVPEHQSARYLGRGNVLLEL